MGCAPCATCITNLFCWPTIQGAYFPVIWRIMDAKKISGLVEKTGLTRAQVADSLGITTTQLRRYERGQAAIPDERLATLQRLAGGPALRPLGVRRIEPAALADVPATALIEELARRARGGTLKDGNSTATHRPLRAVAFTDVPDE